jgi:DNA-binding MarR family transcriptional regulator
VRRFKQPTHTQIPNELIDELMPDLTGAEFKILTYLCRRTFGFHRDSDAIPLSQLTEGLSISGQPVDRGTGLAKSSACDAIKSLEEKGLIWVGRFRDPATGHVSNRYAVLMEWPEVKENITTPLVRKLDKGGSPIFGLPLVRKSDKLNKERNKEEEIKAPRQQPCGKPEPCPLGQCDGTGILGDGRDTLESITSGCTTLCGCEAGQRKADWVREMQA